METPANIKNGDTEQPEKILVYLGSSLPLTKARQILPDAIYRPPCKQGDIVSDVVNLQPNRIILIDGTFRENLSPWHKEIVWALQYPHLKAIYGAASMGALRAAELDFLGMIGIGKIYEWYRDGITDDDSEVAVSYAELPNGDCRCLTVPLVDIRAGVEQYPDQERARAFFEQMRGIFYMNRTRKVCAEAWGDEFFPWIDQKMLDTANALNDFREHKPAPTQQPSPDNLSSFFYALYDRDRRIQVNGTEIPQQHIDAYVLLHNPEYERICWDAANQQLALMLCDQFSVLVSMEEIERENVRFQQKSGIETAYDFECFLENNGWSRAEYDRLIIQNARIRKLQHAQTVTRMYRRNTQSIIDYLRTHQGFDYWALQAVAAEKQIKASGVDDWLGINLETPVFTLLAQHFEKEGLDLKCLHEEYLLETGFSNLTELGVALSRIAAGKEQNG